MSDKTSESSADYILLTRLADEFAARYRAGERPSLQEYIDRYPELADDIRELFPAMVEIEQVKEDHQRSGRARGRAAGSRRAAARRFSHHPRSRQGRHGHRLRGRAGFAGPARRAEGAAQEHAARRQGQAPVRARGESRPPGCTTPISSRSSASASRTACRITSCSSSRAWGWMRCWKS